MIDGNVKGFFLLGQNPAVGSANGRAQRLGMANLDWLVVRDLFEIESATFWKNSPEIETGEIVPEECGTEVFLPAASHAEKEGTSPRPSGCCSGARRPSTLRVTAAPSCGSSHLGRLVRERLAASTDEKDRPVLDLAWDYPVQGAHDEPSAEAVLKEINGYDVATGHAPLVVHRDEGRRLDGGVGAGSTPASTPTT